MKITSRLLCGAAFAAAMISAAMAGEGRVVNAISTLSYTYIEVIEDGKSQWIASDVVSVKPGDRIRFNEGIMMTNFESSDLERTFPAMTFVDKVALIPEK